MAQKPGAKPPKQAKTATGKRTSLTGASASFRPGTQVFSTPPKLTAYEKEMGFKVVKMTRTTNGKSRTYYVVQAKKPGQAKYMASGGTRRPKGRKGGNPPASRPDAPGSRPTNPGLPGLPGWRPWPGP